MIRLLDFLLVLFLVYQCETPPVPVIGEKGGNVTLPCDIEDKEISDIRLSKQSKTIPVDQKNCSHRICKKGKCDVVIKDLRLNDTGTYILRLFSRDAQGVHKLQKEKTYKLHVNESSTQSKKKWENTNDPKKHTKSGFMEVCKYDTEHAAKFWTLCVVLPVLGVLVFLGGMVYFFFIKKPQNQNGGYSQPTNQQESSL